MQRCIPRYLHRPLGRKYSTRVPRACIVGSGPAGFYTAYRILNTVPSAKIDIFEALPVPYGLARFGVAPDHPEVKNVTHKFDEIASSPQVRFLGNVTVGVDVEVSELHQSYDALVFAHGASESKVLGVPGESSRGVVSARSFVGWYNGLPESSTLSISPLLEKARNVVIVGQGNVALDIARILLSPVEELAKTDIANHALETLQRTSIESIRIIGRRGPLQASFTIKEVRELINLTSCSFVNSAKKMYQEILADRGLPRPQKRLLELLAKQGTEVAQRTWDFNYLRSPCEFKAPNGQLESVECEINELDLSGGRVRAKTTGVKESIAADLAFLSIGYQSTPIPGMSDIGVVFDTSRHVIPNSQGRVTSLDGMVEGVYCAGWAKVGPVGVIASTMRDAFETADAITQDWQRSHRGPLRDNDLLVSRILAHKQVIDWSRWKRIEAHERRQGSLDIVPRSGRKVVSIEEMLTIGSG